MFSPAEKEPNENITESNKKDALMFDQFDITHVLKHGEALLGSSGQEYDVFDEELLGKDHDTVVNILGKCSHFLLKTEVS